MKIITTLEPIVKGSPSIYLAGPTPRISGEGSSISRWMSEWRYNATMLLADDFKDGIVYVPEWRDGIRPTEWTYSRQVSWELEALSASSVILFWIPRELSQLPGFTTNIEFGEWQSSNKIVAGAPAEAPKNSYIKERCSRLNIPWADHLDVCISNALKKLKSIIEPVGKIWFTADTHFGSQRTLELSRRPFKSVEEMDWMMIKNWNEAVGDRDTVYHLGDFGDPKYLKLLKGFQINFIKGNYDTPELVSAIKQDLRVSSFEGACVTTSQERLVAIVQNADVNFNAANDLVLGLIHAPEDAIGSWFWLYGHIHALQMVKKNGLNVGVDCHNFKPIDLDTVLFYRNAILNHYDRNVFIETLGDTK